MEYNDREQSEFNSALSYLNRVNTLLYICDESAMNLDSHAWFHALLSLYRELSTEIKKEEVEEFSEIKKRINNLINEGNSNRRMTQKVFSQDLYKELDDFEIKLRRIMKQSGLQLKMKENPRFAMK